jgi:hypothetical protein
VNDNTYFPASPLRDARIDVVGALAHANLDDPKLSEAEFRG